MGVARSPVREQILEAAMRLMEVRGYHRTSLEDVLRESGTGKGNFYHYFQSKEDLGYAILDRIGQRFAEDTLAPSFEGPDRDPLAQVDALFERILAVQREHQCVGGCPLGNLATELADTHEGFRRRLAALFDAWRRRLGTVLEQARATGLLGAEVDPGRLAAFLVAGLEGAVLLTKVQKDIGVMEHCIAELRRHLALSRRAAEVS